RNRSHRSTSKTPSYTKSVSWQHHPASELKIDRAFVNELSADGEDATIVSAIVALAKTLNLKVVAEGVETVEQQQFLTRLGCNTLQGYLLGKPLAPDTITRLGDAIAHQSETEQQVYEK
ncbi:EAL domain-containing protein, partial [Franconibacter helveticus]|uniref:EAL domain-containing protein n=3 Tax=Franconibacter helveticus TaxID=357240 RepID=UPI000566A4D2